MLGHWQLRGYGMWALIEQATGRLIGRAGLYNPEGWPGLEAGWLLARDRWGRGFATEAGRAVLTYAFTHLSADHVISLIHPANTASIRVAERLGERLERSWTSRANGPSSTASTASVGGKAGKSRHAQSDRTCKNVLVPATRARDLDSYSLGMSSMGFSRSWIGAGVQQA
jgi:hypothetical protein